MRSRRVLISIGVYLACFVLSLLLPWWIAIPLLVLPLPFLRYNACIIPIGLVLDVIYGYTLSGFPFHTFRYTIVTVVAVIIAALLKKILRL